MTDQNKKVREWQKAHPERRRSQLRKWYYKHREQVNALMSKPKSSEYDIADEYLDKTRDKWDKTLKV